MTDPEVIARRKMQFRRAIIAIRQCEELLDEIARRKTLTRRRARREALTRRDAFTRLELTDRAPTQPVRAVYRPGGDRGGR